MNQNKLKQLLKSKPFLFLAGLLSAYLLLAYFAVDPIARRALPWLAEQQLGSRMSVDRVRFDPLGLSLTIDNLRLTRLDGSPLAGFERLYMNFESSGLLRFAWRLHDIRLTSPHVVMEIAADGHFNWEDLIAKINEDSKPEEDARPPRLLIEHILIERGHIEYIDGNRPQPFKTVLQPLGLELEGLSTLPESRGDYLLSAKLPEQGGTLKWKGDLALNPLASRGEVEIQQINIAKLMPLVNPQSLPFELKKSRLDSTFSYDLSFIEGVNKPMPQVHLGNISISLTDITADLESGARLALAEAGMQLPALDFALRDGAQVSFQGLNLSARELALTQNGRTLFHLPAANVMGVDFDTTQNHLQVAEILLQEGSVSASRGKDGTIDWQGLLSASDGTAPATQKLDKVATDSTATTAPQTHSATEAAVEPQPLRFNIGSMRLQNWQVAYADETFVDPLTASATGISLAGALGSADEGIVISDINAELGKTTLKSASTTEPMASLDEATLKGGLVSLKDSSVNIDAIRLSGLQTKILREAGKPLNWQAALTPLPASVALAERETAPSPTPPTAWKLTLGELALDHGSVHFVDNSTPTPVVLDVQDAEISLRDGSLDMSKSLPVKASFKFKQGGDFEARGKVAMFPFRSDLHLNLNALAMQPFSPYVNQAALLKLNQGKANLKGKLVLASKKDLSGQFLGGFSIDNLAIHEELDGALFLGWRSVSSNSLKLSLGPNRLHLDELRIEQPVGKFIIYEDRTLNVSRILRQPSPAHTAPIASSPAPASQADPAFPVAVERVSVTDADLEFADLSLTPQFGTRINTLSGVINGLSTDPKTTAQVELDGKVDEFGSARIRGSVQPFRATEYTDLMLVFRNLEMNRLTPYSGKFAGRKIDSGKLSVDLEYKIKERKLAGENKFVINKLKLGDRVESPDAVNLPLDLAIALLEDSDGIIDLDLPISGSLDDPQFSYGKIVWKAILNVIGKVVTSPFRALGKLLGTSADKLESVSFEPGKARLAPEEQEQLKALGEALGNRAALTVTVVPTYDPVADTAAIQEQVARRDVARELGLELKNDETPGPIDLNNVKVQKALENLLKDRRGEKRDLAVLDSLEGYFRKAKPEDLPKYEAMLHQLETTVEVSESELTELARARARELQDYLTQKAGLAAERVSIAAPATTNGDGMVKLKLELGVNGAKNS